MRIVSVRFENLNSFTGQWEIDFSTPEYLSDGIFALTGPTGSGKSTILDAICLALFGQTPRLNSVTKNGNEIMAIGTGDCFAEVLFEVAGTSYRANWSHHRARRRPGGDLQVQRHEVSYASGELIVNGITGAGAEVVKIIGMDFTQFTRSMLLAQGEFTAFLQAPSKERSPILEQITGTEIYSTISMKVYRLTEEKKKELNLLKASLEGIELLPPEEERQLTQELEDKGKAATGLHERIKTNESHLDWIKTIDRLNAEKERIAAENTQLAKREAGFAADEKRLKLALKAHELNGDHVELKTSRDSQAHDLEELGVIQKKLPETVAQQEKATVEVGTAGKGLLDSKKARDEALPAIHEARELDIKIREKDLETKKKTGELNEKEERQRQLVSRSDEIKNELHELNRSRLSRTLERLNLVHNLLSVEGTLLRSYEEELLETKGSVKRLEDEIISVENAILASGSGIEELRDRLKDDEPCPLCGSLAHPYATEESPVPDDRIPTITRLRSQREELTDRITSIELAKAGLNRDREFLNDEKKKLKSALVRLREDATVLFPELSSVDGDKYIDLLGRALQVVPDATVERSAGGFENGLTKLRTMLNSDEEGAGGLHEPTTAALLQQKEVEAKLEELKADILRLTGLIKTLNAERKGLDEARREHLGDKDPVREEARLSGAVDSAQELLDKAKEHLDACTQEHRSCEEKINDLKSRTAKRNEELAKLEERFLERLAEAGFQDESEFRDAVLPPDERSELEQSFRALTRERIALDTQRNENEVQLVKERDRRLTERSRSDLELELERLRAEYEELHKAIGANEQRLEDNEKRKVSQRDKLKLVHAQETDCAKWKALNDLIGSADGNKFREYAQGLTFEVMIAYANRQLQRMTDRYLLERDNKQPLELKVLDNYRAGELRSTTNLSGGESFLVSLSLALGLASMVSKNVSVDSLFLDEGFGTLDEDALENALETLADLQQESGKLIGLISHVPAIKERINTQIQVIPMTGGTSRIEGPGCRRINAAS